MLSKYFPLLIAISFAMQSIVMVRLMNDIQRQNKDILYLMKNQDEIYQHIHKLYID